jgi:hypothetical protein
MLVSRRRAHHPLRGEQGGEFLARVEHAGFHGGTWNPHDRRDLLHRLLVIIDEVDDGVVLGRERAQALAQDSVAMLVSPACFGIGSGIGRVRFYWLGRDVAPAPQFRERLEARNRKQPGRRSRVPPKLGRIPPNREKNLTGEVVGARPIADEAQDEAIDTNLVAREQGVHGEPVAGCDPRNQGGIRHVTSRARRRREVRTGGSPVNSGRFAIIHVNFPFVRIAEINCRSSKTSEQNPDGVSDRAATTRPNLARPFSRAANIVESGRRSLLRLRPAGFACGWRD